MGRTRRKKVERSREEERREKGERNRARDRGGMS